VLYSRSAAAESKVDRMRLCKAVRESIEKGLDHTPVGDWTEKRLQVHVDCMYCATELAHQLNTLRQPIPFTPSGTRFEPEKLPPDQKLIIAQMRATSPAIYGHVMMQMTANPSLVIHAPDLPPRAKLLDANNQILVTQCHYPSFNECVPGNTKIQGDCNTGFTAALRQHNIKLVPECQVFLDANPAGYVYANMHSEGDKGWIVRQVPHDQLMRNTFGGEGDVDDLMQLFAQMEMDEITCIRLVEARLQETELDDKSVTWGATGQRAWGQNVLTGEARERLDIVLAEELAIIHPQAFLQHERAINLDPDTARAIVKLHNDMQRAAAMGGFLLLNHNVPPLLFQDAAFHKFNEMSTIGPWIDRQGMLQWDYVSGASFKGTRSVRNGNARKDALIESGGYMVNDKGIWCIEGYIDLGNLSKDAHIKHDGHMVNNKGVLCIKGYQDLGNLGGAARKHALLESGGHMVNDKGVWCIKGYNDLGNSTKDANIKRDVHMVNNKGMRCITKYHEMGNLGNTAKGKVHEANALSEHHSHICISAICQRGASIRWQDDYPQICHLCYDPAKSGLAGQTARQVKGLKLHICKKCHRTARECKGAGCLAPACRNNSLKSYQHLH